MRERKDRGNRAVDRIHGLHAMAWQGLCILWGRACRAVVGFVACGFSRLSGPGAMAGSASGPVACAHGAFARGPDSRGPCPRPVKTPVLLGFLRDSWIWPKCLLGSTSVSARVASVCDFQRRITGLMSTRGRVRALRKSLQLYALCRGGASALFGVVWGLWAIWARWGVFPIGHLRAWASVKAGAGPVAGSWPAVRGPWLQHLGPGQVAKRSGHRLCQVRPMVRKIGRGFGCEMAGGFCRWWQQRVGDWASTMAYSEPGLDPCPWRRVGRRVGPAGDRAFWRGF